MAMTLSGNPGRRRAMAAAALLILNASVTFENIWPTPVVTWRGAISVELAVVLLGAAILTARGPAPRWTVPALATAWMALVFGRYAEVTAPALYGRDINLYWDLRFIPDVAAMIVRAAPVWLIAAALIAVAVAVLLLHRALSWGFGRVLEALAEAKERRALTTAATVVVMLFVVERAGVAVPVPLPSPVTQTYAHQLALVAEARSGTRSLAPTPPMDSSFDQLDGADVFLVFVESYGAVSYAPNVAPHLAPARSRLEADVAATGREAVSAFVESPTFGGSSWLAHLSLVSGIEVRDPDTNALLMTQPRDTLVKTFGRHGFRTVALMPGLRQQWPEGRFYGFDEIYGADRLAYTGPEFGWFAIPDQFSLAKLDALEEHRGTARRFVFFPTISTHFPFSPTPPYQPDWRRLFTALPYDGPDIVNAYAHEPNWTDFTPGYIDALTYDLAVLGGYLRQWPERKLVMILIGDHQPPAAVSGEGASWNVPVHVIANQPALIDRLKARGFVAGLTPTAPAISRMHQLLPVLLDVFGDHD
jgi:hypothetical protein